MNGSIMLGGAAHTLEDVGSEARAHGAPEVQFGLYRTGWRGYRVGGELAYINGLVSGKWTARGSDFVSVNPPAPEFDTPEEVWLWLNVVGEIDE